MRFDVPLQGKGRSPLFADPAAAHHDAVFSAIADRAMICTDRWKLGRYGEGGGELYDMDADPREQTNLFGDPAHQAVRAQLESRLLRHTLRSIAASRRFTVAPPNEAAARAVAAAGER